MKNIFFSLISIAAFAVVFSACKKQDDVKPNYGNSSASASQYRVSDECDSCCANGVLVDSISAGPVSPGPRGIVFPDQYYDFCTGEDGTSNFTEAKIKFKGNFLSSVEGINGWKVELIADSTCFVDYNDCDDVRGAVEGGTVCSNTVGRHFAPSTPTCTGWFNYLSPMEGGPAFNKRANIVVHNGLTSIDDATCIYVLCLDVEAVDHGDGTYSAKLLLTYKGFCCQ